MDKSIIFIDAENVIKSWIRYCENNGLSEKIDYKKLVDKISENTDLIRPYFYDGVPDPITMKKKSFMEALQHLGFQMKTKPLKYRPVLCQHCNVSYNKAVQKGVDVALATDILRHSWQETADILIVVSGDEDYLDAIQCAMDKGQKVWIASFKDCLSSELRLAADKAILIDEIFDDVKMEIKQKA